MSEVNAARAMLAALKTAHRCLDPANTAGDDLNKIEDAIAQAEAAGIKAENNMAEGSAMSMADEIKKGCG